MLKVPTSQDRSMVLLSENALPGVDGRWKSSKHGGVKTIQGRGVFLVGVIVVDDSLVLVAAL